MRKAVVTGGAGFIGSHIADELVARGYHVIILDDLSSGKLENINGLLNNGQAELIRGSVTDLPLLRKLFQGAEYVFHQAALTQIPSSIEDPLPTNEVNIGGTLKVLVAAEENKVKKVIYASSSALYGDTTSIPHKEDMVPNPLSPYAVTKLAGEQYAAIFHRIHGLSTASLRYFNIYGPRQDAKSQYATVIPAFVTLIGQDQPPVIYGDGEQTRDFTYVKDVAQANILAAESEANGAYNVGSGQNVTINHLIQFILRLMAKNVPPVYNEPRPGELKHSLADITRARGFGYQPRWSLEDGLSETIAYLSATPQQTTTKQETS